jgi:hypothetical protein
MAQNVEALQWTGQRPPPGADFHPRQSPYGFRFTSGTLTGPDGSTHAITDVFELLDAIARARAPS